MEYTATALRSILSKELNDFELDTTEDTPALEVMQKYPGGSGYVNDSDRSCMCLPCPAIPSIRRSKEQPETPLNPQKSKPVVPLLLCLGFGSLKPCQLHKHLHSANKGHHFPEPKPETLNSPHLRSCKPKPQTKPQTPSLNPKPYTGSRVSRLLHSASRAVPVLAQPDAPTPGCRTGY